MKIENPFSDWTEDKQCFDRQAEKENGSSILATNPEACKWCAFGYLIFKGIPVDIRNKFSEFLLVMYYAAISDLNDIIKWKPKKFKEAWDKFAGEFEAKLNDY